MDFEEEKKGKNTFDLIVMLLYLLAHIIAGARL